MAGCLQPHVCVAQSAPSRKTSAPDSALVLSISAFGGNVALSQGASLSVIDVTTGASGVSQEFQPRFSGGLRADGEAGRFCRVALEGSLAWVKSPITLTRGALVQHKTISLMESDIALLVLAQAPLPIVRPYAGAGPALLITHADEQGGYRFAAGLRCVAGVQVLVGQRFYAFVEGRFAWLADRRYTFDALGVQDSEYATMAADVHGSHRAFVIGAGWRIH